MLYSELGVQWLRRKEVLVGSPALVHFGPKPSEEHEKLKIEKIIFCVFEFSLAVHGARTRLEMRERRMGGRC